MSIGKAVSIPIHSEDDIFFALSAVRHAMDQLAFSPLDQQKVFVSVSELTRNILDHAGGKGNFSCEKLGQGIRVIVTDEGPGIQKLDHVLRGEKQPGSRGLGLGLSGVTRLMDEVRVETSARGTRVVAIKWPDKQTCYTRSRTDIGSYIEPFGFHRSNCSRNRP